MWKPWQFRVMASEDATKSSRAIRWLLASAYAKLDFVQLLFFRNDQKCPNAVKKNN